MNKYTKQLDVHCYDKLPTIFNIYNDIKHIKHIDKHINTKELSKRQLLNELLDINCNRDNTKIYYRYVNIDFKIRYFQRDGETIFKTSNNNFKGYISCTKKLLKFINDYKITNNNYRLVKLITSFDNNNKPIYDKFLVDIETYINNKLF